MSIHTILSQEVAIKDQLCKFAQSMSDTGIPSMKKCHKN